MAFHYTLPADGSFVYRDLFNLHWYVHARLPGLSVDRWALLEKTESMIPSH